MKLFLIFIYRVAIPLLAAGGGAGWIGGNVLYYLAILINVHNAENNYGFIVATFSIMGLVFASYVCIKSWKPFSLNPD